MRFLSTRDLRNRPGLVRELVQQEDFVLTSNGKPIAILLGIGEEDLDETAQAVKQARAQRALSRMRQEAAKRGIDRSSSSAIDAQIRSVRSQRRSG
jgi:antitoxin (DNA-binding transcriptional repressor) of toxin-antitoxin stability system